MVIAPWPSAGAVRGNAPIMTATRTPRSKPKMIEAVRTHDQTETANHASGSKELAGNGARAYSAPRETFESSNVIVAQTQSTQALQLAPLPIIECVLHFSHQVLPISDTPERSGNRWVSE